MTVTPGRTAIAVLVADGVPVDRAVAERVARDAAVSLRWNDRGKGADAYICIGEPDAAAVQLSAAQQARSLWLLPDWVPLRLPIAFGAADAMTWDSAGSASGWRDVLSRAARIGGQVPGSDSGLGAKALSNLVGRAPAFLRTVEHLRLYAPSEVPILISGESGTGKELFGRAIHYLSPLARGPFVPVNCAALPDHLFENELFGHVAGAYTDARKDVRGLIAEAEGGTLFLDEIGSLSPHGQAALLRFVQSGEYRALGGGRLVQSSVRIVAAANLDFEAAIAARDFREDLFFRLAVGHIELPALRQRPGDAALLAERYRQRLAARDAHVPEFSAAARAFIDAHDWPGNVRQLENFVDRYALLGDRAIATVRPSRGDASSPAAQAEYIDLCRWDGMQAAKVAEGDRFERAYLIALMVTSGGNMTEAARLAKKDRSVLSRLMKKHGLSRKHYREGGHEREGGHASGSS